MWFSNECRDSADGVLCCKCIERKLEGFQLVATNGKWFGNCGKRIFQRVNKNVKTHNWGNSVSMDDPNVACGDNQIESCQGKTLLTVVAYQCVVISECQAFLNTLRVLVRVGFQEVVSQWLRLSYCVALKNTVQTYP